MQIKYLLCRPLGGLNDCLCQIEFTRKISRLKRRTLLIQTETGSPGLQHRFGAKFSDIFDVDGNFKYEELSSSIIERVGDSIFPKVFKDFVRLHNYSLQEITSGRQYRMRIKKFSIRKENLIIHESWGGGLASATLLRYLTLNPKLKNDISKILLNLPKNLTTVHFRATDYLTSVEILNSTLINLNDTDPILIASDNSIKTKKIINFFKEKNILLSSNVYDAKTLGLSSIEIAIADLVIMANSENLIVLPIEDGFKSGNKTAYSGYSRLAKHIWSVNKIHNSGFIGWVRTDKRFVGLAAFKFKFSNFFYLSFYEIPRIISHAINPKGFYKEMLSFE